MRTEAYGQRAELSPVDRFGVYLSARSIRRAVGGLAGKRVGDFGCGYTARIATMALGPTAELVLVDIALAVELKTRPGTRAIEGVLPTALAGIEGESLDVVLLISVLEHLDAPSEALAEIERVLAPGGTAVINVPSWLGKRFLEFAAFRLGVSPREEMDDHRRYYDPRDLWPQLVSAGFLPHNISCRRHKFAMNTFAVCHKEPRAGTPR